MKLKLHNIVKLRNDTKHHTFKIGAIFFDRVRIESLIFGKHWVNYSDVELLNEVENSNRQ